MRYAEYKEIIKGATIASGLIFITALMIDWSPWKKLHYGDQPQKIVYTQGSAPPQSQQPKSPHQPVAPVVRKGKHSRHARQKVASTDSPKSTMTAVKEDNSLKVDNSPGSINVAGKNNTVYVNAEKELTDAGLVMVTRKVDSIRNQFNIPKSIVFTTFPYFNAPLVYNKLLRFFQSRGYAIGTGTELSNGPMLEGFAFNRTSDNSEVTVSLGYFK